MQACLAALLISVTPAATPAAGDEILLTAPAVHWAGLPYVGRIPRNTRLRVLDVDAEGGRYFVSWLGVRDWIDAETAVPISEAGAGLDADVSGLPSSGGHRSRAVLLHAAGRTEDALRAVEEEIRREPDRAVLYVDRACLRFKLGDAAGAEADLAEASRRAPDSAAVRDNRGRFRVHRGDLDAGIADLTEAIRLYDSSWWSRNRRIAPFHVGRTSAYAYLFRGLAWEQKGESEKALDDYGYAAWLDPDGSQGVAAHALCGRAALLADLGRYREALAGYAKAAAVDPKSAEARSGTAWVLATCPESELRDGGEAVRHAEAALELAGRGDESALGVLAAALAESGDFAGAAERQRAAVGLATGERAARQRSRLATFEAGRPHRDWPRRRPPVEAGRPR